MVTNMAAINESNKNMTHSTGKWISFIGLAIVLTVVTLLMSGAERITWRIVLVFFILSSVSSFLVTNVIFRFLRNRK
jgi:heme/copper-type cytochrome/quinol oxidase subunit 4